MTLDVRSKLDTTSTRLLLFSKNEDDNTFFKVSRKFYKLCNNERQTQWLVPVMSAPGSWWRRSPNWRSAWAARWESSQNFITMRIYGLEVRREGMVCSLAAHRGQRLTLERGYQRNHNRYNIAKTPSFRKFFKRLLLMVCAMFHLWLDKHTLHLLCVWTVVFCQFSCCFQNCRNE